VALQSILFKGDPALEACLFRDSAHVTKGAVGAHVVKIQFALALIDQPAIDPAEVDAKTYGDTTANAVKEFKTQRRRIIKQAVGGDGTGA
jgi:hypothetical protein